MDTVDGLVHCIKPGRMAADAAAVILAETTTVLAGNKDFNKSDPFASDEGSTVIDDN